MICPDPEELAYDSDVTISQGLGEPTKATGLVRCGQGWRYNTGCSEDVKDSAFNYIPTENVRHGMKVLDVSDGAEWRNYCRDGGYVGQTDGTSLIVLPPNGWIAINGSQPSSVIYRIVGTIHDHAAK